MNCNECLHHGTVPGSAHLKCVHPKTADSSADPLAEMMAIFAGVGRSGPSADMVMASSMGVTINHHGFRHGWANWPWNFDPIWIETCDCFEKRH